MGARENLARCRGIADKSAPTTACSGYVGMQRLREVGAWERMLEILGNEVLRQSENAFGHAA